MKIEQKRVRHSWLTRVTTGDKSFGLQHLAEGKVRVFDPFGGSVRHGATATDFSSLEDAMAFMDPLSVEIQGEVVDLRTDVEVDIAKDSERYAQITEALKGETHDLEEVVKEVLPDLCDLATAELERTGKEEPK